MINKNGKLFGKISIVDIMVILAIVVAAFALYTRFSSESTQKISTEKQQIEYTMLVKGVRQGTVDALKKGGSVTNTLTKEYAGSIDTENIIIAPAADSRELPNGEVVAVEIPEKYDVTLRILIDGSVNDLGFYTPTNQTINIGSTQNFVTKYATTSGIITNVKKAE